MPHIVVCSLAAVEDQIAAHGSTHLVTLLSPGSLPDTPAPIAASRHLRLAVNDIDEEIEGYTAPGPEHIERILRFAESWDGQTPLLIHCWAGISRSTATAYIVACARNPHASEHDIAQALRKASPTARPNRRMVALADWKLGRGGRMNAAVDAMAPPNPAETAAPFAFPVRF